jgi:hypothetical protein
MTIVEFAATSAIDVPTRPPYDLNASRASDIGSYPITGYPPTTKLLPIADPILPRPISPISYWLAIRILPCFLRAVCFRVSD